MVNISVTGAFEAIDKLKADRRDVLNAMTKTMQNVGFYVEGKVKESIAGQSDEPASVDTGQFINSVTSNVSTELSSRRQQAIIFTPLDYPVYLEYGTSTIAPRRHFQNTAAREQTHVQEMMKDAVKEALK